MPPGGAAVVALVAALGYFHLAQQGVHLVQGEAPVGAHRAVAGHGGQQLVLGALQHVARVVLGQFGQHAAGEFHRVALRQGGGHGAHRQGARGQGRHVQAQRGQCLGTALRGGCFLGRGREGGGDQQRLAGQRALGELALEPFVDDALVRRVHVHDDQALRVLGQDVDALQLGDGAAQGPVAVGEGGVGFD